MLADKKFMERCFQLARCGMGAVSPNPMVGAVVVYEGKIIGEGYHRKYGEAHAEVNAIASVKDPALLSRSTLYVNLEPCSHYGKTPPCAHLIIEKKIPRVVIGCLDPFPEVAGRGVRLLREAGIEVTVGVSEAGALELNERFIWFHRYKAPYIIAKWAQSADGYMDKCRSSNLEPPAILSSPATRRLVHKLRAEVDGILVGATTALLDNPSLSVRYWDGYNPVRMVIDPDLTVPENASIYDGTAPTFVFTRKETKPHRHVEFVLLSPGKDPVQEIKEFLYARNIQTLLVEGGAATLKHFFESGVNEIRVEYTGKWLQHGVQAPEVSLEPVDTFSLDHSVIRIFKGNPVVLG